MGNIDKLREKEALIKDIRTLLLAYKEGELGGEIMPEDCNPGLKPQSAENYLFFTLPMALNYQRNSYKLWESATATYNDSDTNWVFTPKEVLRRQFEEVQEALTKYKIALQKNKQTEIWIRLCNTFSLEWKGDVRNIFIQNKFQIKKIKECILTDKKLYPYLSGNKILNYWLYVMGQYTDAEFMGREHISVAPDTHVIQASVRLGLIEEKEADSDKVRLLVSKRWEDILKDTEINPIDIHTPLWLWSRSEFQFNINNYSNVTSL